MKICKIYIIKNYVNGKVYIGQTWNDLKERYRIHNLKNSPCIKLHRALKKYGKEKMIIEELANAYTQEQADDLEIAFIEVYDSIKSGYNIRKGGSRGMLSEESKRKISKANKGRPGYWTGKKRNEEMRRKLSVYRAGRPLSDETKKKIAKASSERTHTEEIKQKISKILTGRKFTEEHRINIGIASSGRKHTEETKKMISKTLSGENCYKAKLTWEIVVKIREEYKTTNISHSKLAKKYNIDKSSIGRIIRNQTWKTNEK